MFTVLLLTTSYGRAFQVVVILMGKKRCATDVLNRFSIIIFFILSPIIEVVLKATYWTGIVESVQIFEHLNSLPWNSPLYEANEF